MERICIGPPTDGATSVCARTGLSSPVACTTTGTSPSATRAVGMRPPSVCTPCVGDTTDASAQSTSATASTPASDQPRRLTIRFCHDGFIAPAEWDPSAPRAAGLHALRTTCCSCPRRAICYQPLVPATAGASNIRDRAAFFLEDRTRWNQHRVRHAIDGDANRRIHTRPQPRIDRIELDDHVEVALWRPVREIDACERTDVADLAIQLLSGTASARTTTRWPAACGRVRPPRAGRPRAASKDPAPPRSPDRATCDRPP